MEEKLKEEVKALIDAGKYEEAKKKIDELIAMQASPASSDGEKDKPTIGGGGSGLPIGK